MAKSNLDNLIAAMERGIEKGLVNVGKTSVQIFRQNAAESDASGRLSAGLTFATKLHPATQESPALASDIVPTPTEKGVLFTGTRVPYVDRLEHGSFGRPFEYGKDGNASNINELYKQILQWIKDKGISSYNGHSDQQLADSITNSIDANGTEAHPFYYKSIDEIKASAGKIIGEAISLEVKTMKPVATTIEFNI
jgi:hypothetical protein